MTRSNSQSFIDLCASEHAWRGGRLSIYCAIFPTVKTVVEPSGTLAPGGGAGMVWVNTETHVYHHQGSRWYGRTKKGKYMTEADAIKEGDRVDKEEKPKAKP